jgi:long-chain acyl-CoA synthetase
MTDVKPWYKYWPESVPKEIGIPEIPLISVLQNTVKTYPDAIATTYFGAGMTYATLNMIVEKIAGYLHKIGLKKGETVALYFTNNPACVAAYYGTLRAGGIVTLLSPLFQNLEAKFQLNDSEAKVLIAWEGFEDLIKDVLPQTKVQHLIYSNAGNWMLENPADPSNEKVDPTGKNLYLEDIILEDQPVCPEIPIDPKKDLAVLQYTGGTTGLPKGAMLTHYNVVANVEQCVSVFPNPEMGKEVMLTALPLYHIYAQTVAMNFSVRIAANMIMVFNPRETEDMIEKIEENKVTIFPGVAALYNLINNYPGIENKNLKSVKYCLSGAGPLPLEIQTKFEKLTGAKLREGFGLTEASPITHVNPLNGRFKNGTVGFPVPNTDMKIVDLETGEKILGIGEVGELCIKGPQIMQGYYKKDKENKMVLRDGWLYTGDAAMLDEEGYTVIKERLKNMLKYKGHSVYPAEVEALLLENDKILEVAVIGVPDPEVGENIKAYVVLKPEYVGKVDVAEIKDWAKANMSSYKYPREIEFLAEIPKSAVGKILHRELRDMNKKK